RRLESRVVWLALVGIAVVTALVIAAWRFGGSDQTSLPLSRPAVTPRAAQKGGLLVQAKKGVNTLLIVRAGSETGRQLWNGTLSNRDVQLFDALHGLWIYLGSLENVTMRLNGRGVVVGGSKLPRLMITPGGFAPAVPF